MRCLKAFEERIASRDSDRQTAEIHIRVALMNRCSAFGPAEIERLNWHQRVKGLLAQPQTSATTPRRGVTCKDRPSASCLQPLK